MQLMKMLRVLSKLLIYEFIPDSSRSFAHSYFNFPFANRNFNCFDSSSFYYKRTRNNNCKQKLEESLYKRGWERALTLFISSTQEA